MACPLALHSQDTYILGGVDEVMAVLEDSMVVVATISASRFVAGIRCAHTLARTASLFSSGVYACDPAKIITTCEQQLSKFSTHNSPSLLLYHLSHTGARWRRRSDPCGSSVTPWTSGWSARDSGCTLRPSSGESRLLAGLTKTFACASAPCHVQPSLLDPMAACICHTQCRRHPAPAASRSQSLHTGGC